VLTTYKFVDGRPRVSSKWPAFAILRLIIDPSHLLSLFRNFVCPETGSHRMKFCRVGNTHQTWSRFFTQRV